MTVSPLSFSRKLVCQFAQVAKGVKHTHVSERRLAAMSMQAACGVVDPILSIVHSTNKHNYTKLQRRCHEKNYMKGSRKIDLPLWPSLGTSQSISTEASRSHKAFLSPEWVEATSTRPNVELINFRWLGFRSYGRNLIIVSPDSNGGQVATSIPSILITPRPELPEHRKDHCRVRARHI